MSIGKALGRVGIVLSVAATVVCGGGSGDGGSGGGGSKATGGGKDGSFTDPRDEQKYRTVKIGDIVWMAENLNYMPEISWCYGDDESNCKKYGRLYDWQSAKAACPSGWHLPNDGEWDKLIEATSSDERFAGKKLKSTTGWDDSEGKSGNGTDDYGFSALPGGRRNPDGSFYDAGYFGYWWSATESWSDYPYFRSMYSYYDRMYERNSYKSYGFSVRCAQ